MTLHWRGFDLHAHQTRPAASMACDDGIRSLMMFYSVGSGKTLAALYTVSQLAKYWRDSDETITMFPRVMIVAPAKVLTEVWEPTIRLLKLPFDRFWLRSFDMTRLHYEEYAGSLRIIRRSHIEDEKPTHPYYTVLIVDESHVVRTTSSQTFHAVFAIAAEVDKVLLLTGTPMVNSIEDMQSQLRLLTDDSHATVPAPYFVNPKTFSGKILTHLVPLNADDYPATDRVVHQVPMYPLQKQRYDEFDREMLTPALKEMLEKGIISTALNSFLTRTRAISNTVGRYLLPGELDTAESSAKFRGIRKSLLEDPKPAVVYSFYLENGVIPLKKFVDSTTTLRTALLTGNTKAGELRDILNRYNNEKTIDVLFLTSAVRQGITLLRTRTMHIMESGWNESLQEQVFGRVVRYLSHADLPLTQRHVQIHFWLTTLGLRVSTDQYIYGVAQRKMEVISRVEEIISRLRQPRLCLKPYRSRSTHRAESATGRRSKSLPPRLSK
jgi:superfamily II DNA or RNA helicase